MITQSELILSSLECVGYAFALDAESGKISHQWTMHPAAPPADCKSLLAELRTRRDEVAQILHRWKVAVPHLVGNTLVIPFDAHPRYRWWLERPDDPKPLTICEILSELAAPDRLHSSYCGSGCKR